MPLNFLRMPVGVHTTSPFLYFCWAAVSGVRERDEDVELEHEPPPPPDAPWELEFEEGGLSREPREDEEDRGGS